MRLPQSRRRENGGTILRILLIRLGHDEAHFGNTSFRDSGRPPCLGGAQGLRGLRLFSAVQVALPTEEELLTKLPGCVGYLAGVEKVSAKVLETAKELRVISRNGTGADAIDVAAAERLGIKG